MRKSRIIEETAAFYHVMSRVVGREFVFGEEERERFCGLMRRVELMHGKKIEGGIRRGDHVVIRGVERRKVDNQHRRREAGY